MLLLPFIPNHRPFQLLSCEKCAVEALRQHAHHDADDAKSYTCSEKPMSSPWLRLAPSAGLSPRPPGSKDCSPCTLPHTEAGIPPTNTHRPSTWNTSSTGSSSDFLGIAHESIRTYLPSSLESPTRNPSGCRKVYTPPPSPPFPPFTPPFPPLLTRGSPPTLCRHSCVGRNPSLRNTHLHPSPTPPHPCPNPPPSPPPTSNSPQKTRTFA